MCLGTHPFLCYVMLLSEQHKRIETRLYSLCQGMGKQQAHFFFQICNFFLLLVTALYNSPDHSYSTGQTAWLCYKIFNFMALFNPFTLVDYEFLKGRNNALVIFKLKQYKKNVLFSKWLEDNSYIWLCLSLKTNYQNILGCLFYACQIRLHIFKYI